MSTIHVEIVSAEGEIFSGDVEMIVAPAKMGELGIKPRHAPLITTLQPGEIRLQIPDEEEKQIYVTGGIIEVQPHLVTVLADSALHADQLDEDAAREAQEAAEKAMSGAVGEDLVTAQENLVEAAARYRAAQNLRGKRR